MPEAIRLFGEDRLRLLAPGNKWNMWEERGVPARVVMELLLEDRASGLVRRTDVKVLLDKIGSEVENYRNLLEHMEDAR